MLLPARASAANAICISIQFCSAARQRLVRPVQRELAGKNEDTYSRAYRYSGIGTTAGETLPVRPMCLFTKLSSPALEQGSCLLVRRQEIPRE